MMNNTPICQQNKQPPLCFIYSCYLPSKYSLKNLKIQKKYFGFKAYSWLTGLYFSLIPLQKFSFFFNCDPKGVSVGWWHWWLSLLPPPHTTPACIKVPLIATSKYGDTRYGRIILPCNRLQTTTPKVLGS